MPRPRSAASLASSPAGGILRGAVRWRSCFGESSTAPWGKRKNVRNSYDRQRSHWLELVDRSDAIGYGLRITRVAAVPAPLPCHSAKAKALLTSASGKLCETIFESGYLSFVLTRKSRAAGMIHGL